MAIFETENHEIYADCHCGCDNGFRIRIEKDDFDDYCFCTYTSGNFYTMQSSFTTRRELLITKVTSFSLNTTNIVSINELSPQFLRFYYNLSTPNLIPFVLYLMQH